MTQRDVAKAIGVSGAALSQWEGDERVPREDALAKLATYLEVTPAYLRYGLRTGGEPTPEQIAAFLNGELKASREHDARLASERDAGARKAGGAKRRRRPH